MSQTILFTPQSEQDDYFSVMTEFNTPSKIFKNGLPQDVIERFRSCFGQDNKEYFYGKSVFFGTLVLLD